MLTGARAGVRIAWSVTFDPTQAAHAVSQIAQAEKTYTTTVQTAQNVIGAYNLAQRMASSPSSLYTSYGSSELPLHRRHRDAEHRIRAIAKEYAKQPAATIVVSPDNASRREINKVVREELQLARVVSPENHTLPTLIPRSELTGADRQWAQK